MATRKITITIPDEIADALSEIAEQDGVPVSRLITGAAEAELRRRGARKVIADWQAEHGAFTPDELAAARAEMAAADLEVLGPRRAAA
jgi:predicted transcriptional regulator